MSPHDNHGTYRTLNTKEDFAESEAETLFYAPTFRSRILQAYRWIGFLTAFLLLILTSIQTTILTLNAHESSSPHIPAIVPQPCGTTATQARHLGCLFAEGLAAWVPPTCYDAALEASFSASHPNFEWYYGQPTTDLPDPTRRIPDVETLSNMTEYAYTTWGYHKAHCTHTWKLSHRAMENGWEVRGKVRGWEHVKHCEGVLLGGYGEIEDGRIWTRVTIDFPDCVGYRDVCRS